MRQSGRRTKLGMGLGWGPDEFLGGGEEGRARLVSTGQMAEINRPNH